VTGALPRSFDKRQRVNGSFGPLGLPGFQSARSRVAALAIGADFRRLRTELRLEVRFNNQVLNLRPAQSEQANPAAGGQGTGVSGTGVQLVVRRHTAIHSGSDVLLVCNILATFCCYRQSCSMLSLPGCRNGTRSSAACCSIAAGYRRADMLYEKCSSGSSGCQDMQNQSKVPRRHIAGRKWLGLSRG